MLQISCDETLRFRCDRDFEKGGVVRIGKRGSKGRGMEHLRGSSYVLKNGLCPAGVKIEMGSAENVMVLKERSGVYAE